MSDAVVDYYYNKKIAYDYIKRSQQPFAILIGELENWGVKVVASNDTLQKVSGSYTVKDIESGVVLSKGDFCVDENKNAVLGEIPIMYSDKGMFLIEWTIGDRRFINHYLYGYPSFDLEKYRTWHTLLNESI